jgi:ubiquinone biosynthesis accessory factor UbiK
VAGAAETSANRDAPRWIGAAQRDLVESILDAVRPSAPARTSGQWDMDKTGFLDDLQRRLAALLAASPAADMQKNMKALLAQQFARLDLVTHDELETQVLVLARTREKLEALELRVEALEASRPAAQD